VVVAVGFAADRRREVLGFDVGDTESQPFWTTFLRSLKSRGLDGVKLVIFDAHTGLIAAINTVFQGSSRRRRLEIGVRADPELEQRANLALTQRGRPRRLRDSNRSIHSAARHLSHLMEGPETRD
jgi:transposase-like protein